MNLGFSHEVVFPEPSGIKIEVTDQLKIKITGIDRQLVGQVAANIRSIKMPEPYKGKGIKYNNETIRRKAGKTGKK
jgi:large subunit ribosomal protein L6